MQPADHLISATAAETSGPASFHHYLPISDEIFDGGVFDTSVGAGRVAPGESYPRQIQAQEACYAVGLPTVGPDRRA